MVKIRDFVDLGKNNRVRASTPWQIHACFQRIIKERFQNTSKSHARVNFDNFSLVSILAL